ncbi:chorismate mutase 2-like isoform X1 [Primulina tabacum]|uniref:chorismate mutase 2-like isoform X1 n=2 Tax=Primulina tabacum TaxID=48773 RepID=UPI003F5985FE
MFRIFNSAVLTFILISVVCKMAQSARIDELLNLDYLRKSLVRQEDTIIFYLIERAKYPRNLALYEEKCVPESSDSLFDFFLKESEALQAKAGRYTSPEENAFFPDKLPAPLLQSLNSSTQILHPAGASINVNDKISHFYLKKLLPLITSEGDDGNYAATAVSDLDCLQALSRRIHLGKFVAEVKFRDAPADYTPAVHAKNREALMELLTFPSVEKAIKKRVAKKAMIFGQDVDLQENDTNGKYKVNPSVVSQLYEEWVMPLTKFVEVEYLLRHLE